jgi:hypothetical protein
MTATVAKRVIWVLMALMASAAQPACGAEPGAPLIVADSLSHEPLAYASVFDRDGHFLGTTTTDGMVKCAVAADYPLTIRHMGFHELRIEHPVRRPDTLFMVENIPELPEVEVMAARKRVLHILAYMREYSTLAGYTDTVSLFREKMVDFMLPDGEASSSFKGWRNPRMLNSRSYYRFSRPGRPDSVSNRSNHHFTWSDWIGVMPPVPIPESLTRAEQGTDTIHGRYTPSEVWARRGDRFTVDINVLADQSGRKWVPDLGAFFRQTDVDFERFRLRLTYNNVVVDNLDPLDLTGYSYNIESRGRGHGMFMFGRRDEPIYVTTYTEVYVLDKEYVSVKEARRWEKRRFDREDVDIYEPADAPPLDPSIQHLVDRVNNIDDEAVRRSHIPDYRLASRKVRKQRFDMGTRALSLLKQATGISRHKFYKNFNNNWRDFSRRQQEHNKASADTTDRSKPESEVPPEAGGGR